MSMKELIIYSDGGADPNPGIGGWAAILRFGQHEKVLTGNDPDTTNNRMELTAAVEALKALKEACSVDFHTDSQYVRRGISEYMEQWKKDGWSRKGKALSNVDLWRQLDEQANRHEIRWHWVKGHAGDRLNSRVDHLARDARLLITPKAERQDGVANLYVRASVRGNPGPGAWGVVREFGGETEQFSGTKPECTNNQMEVQGAVEAIRLCEPGEPLQLFTTSDYLFQGATKWLKGWRKRNWRKKDGAPIANQELWKELDILLEAQDVWLVNAKGYSSEEQPSLEEARHVAAEALAQM